MTALTGPASVHARQFTKPEEDGLAKVDIRTCLVDGDSRPLKHGSSPPCPLSVKVLLVKQIADLSGLPVSVLWNNQKYW